MEYLQSLENPLTKRTGATVVLVLGMHRSGTSAVTRVWNLLGAQLGDNLLPPARDNETGFWEQREIHEIHETLLLALGSTWDDQRRLPGDWFKTAPAETARARILDVLRRDFNSSKEFVVKDPRICRLVPLWLSVVQDMGAQPRFLVIVRNPLEVAASLEKRDGFPAAKSVLVWLRYTLDAEHDTRGFPRAFVSYEGLLADWRRTMSVAADRLGLDVTAEIPVRGAEVDAFLSTEHRHQRFSEEALALNPVVSGWARRVFTVLQRMCEASSVEWEHKLDGIAAELDNAQQLYGPWLALQQDEIRARGAHRKGLSREMDVPRSEAAVQRTQMHAVTDELSSVRRLIADRDAHVGELTRQVEAVSEESRRLREQIKELSSQMQRVNEEHAAREVRQQQLLEELTDLLPPERLFRFCLDEPISWHLNKPMVELRGWCFHRRGEKPTGVRARINGRTVAGQHGLSRPDVARVYPHAAGATESGFVISLRAPPGKSRLAVEFLTERHGWVEVFSATCRFPFLTGAIGRGLYLLRRRTQSRPQQPSVRRLNEEFEFTIDDPSQWNLPRHKVQVRGWCFHRQGRKIVAVRARVNGKEWIGRVGLRRTDVGSNHPSLPEANMSGFEIKEVVARGRFTMTVEVKTEGGGWRALCEAKGRAPIVSSRRQPEPTDYTAWIREYDRLTWRDKIRIRKLARQLKYQPTFSVVMPAHNTPEIWLRKAIESVRMQLYPRWELCVANDASTEPHVRRVLDAYARRDKRIKVVHRTENGHISRASNSALELAAGDFIALLDHDDELRPHSLFMVAEELNRHPDTDLVYTDEDKIDGNGNRSEPYFKTDWNPDLVRSANYVNHLGVYRTRIVRELGGFRHEFVGSQDYDLLLRFMERISANRIRHVPHVLYHWRAIAGSVALDEDEKLYAHKAARTAIQAHLQRRGIQADVVPAGVGHYHRIIYPLPMPRPPVTVIMLSGPKPQYLAMGLNSVLRKTNYDNLRLLLVANRVQQPESLQLIEEARQDPRLTVLPYHDPFNFSRMNNLGVAECTSELVVFLNDDVEVINGDWLDELVRHGVRPEVAAVGPMLFYPDDTIQHAGVVLGIQGVAGHVHRCLKQGHHGYFGRAGLIQNFSALTAGCLLTRRSVFQEVGGFDEEFAVAFNDVDLCLRIREKGYLLTWTPYAQLYHHESVTLGRHNSPARAEQFGKEVNYFRQKWGRILEADPHYSPNLTLKSEDFALAFPPRVGKPWQRGGRGAAVAPTPDGVAAK